MPSAAQIDALKKVLQQQLNLQAIDAFPKATVVGGREFVQKFRSSRKIWLRLMPGGLEQVTQLRTDDFDFCTGPNGSCYDWDDGRVELVEFDNPMLIVIFRAWEED